MSSRVKPKPEARQGMWSTLGGIVQSGWGPTLRLLSIIAVTGVTFSGVGNLTGAFDLLEMLRNLIPGD